jgi:hypothetical protein
VDSPWLVEKLIWVANNGKPKERLEALDRIMTLRGDIKDKNSASPMMVNNGPVMVVVGATQERMKALRGAIPQLSPERAEGERAARANERLAELKRGNQADIATHSKARIDELEVSDVESGAHGTGQQTESSEG